jgi:hypothetical protein
MNPRAQDLLMRWILHVMKMLMALPVFSLGDRQELAEITLELDKEIMRVRADRAVTSCEGGHRGPFVRGDHGQAICVACGEDLSSWGAGGKPSS